MQLGLTYKAFHYVVITSLQIIKKCFNLLIRCNNNREIFKENKHEIR
jgi:hypothetical protein